MMIDSSRSASVTGGAAGLGGATAAMLASHGVKVTIVDLNEEAGAAHAAAIGGVFAKANVADEARVAAALDVAKAAHGVTRILVNCAGVAPAIKTVGKENVPHPLDAFRRTSEVILFGTFYMIAQCAARRAAAEPIGVERG